MDMWAIACTVYELFTADILFKGRDNNDMLRRIMDLKGPFPKKMLKKGMFSSEHFAGAPHAVLLVLRSGAPACLLFPTCCALVLAGVVNVQLRRAA